jgi:hypothetical protein
VWNLILTRGRFPTIVDVFSTKKEVQDEINNRTSMIQHLGYDPKKIYKIKKCIKGIVITSNKLEK